MSQYSILTKQACGLTQSNQKSLNKQNNVSQMLLNREVSKTVVLLVAFGKCLFFHY